MSNTQVESAEDRSAVFNGVRLHYRVAGDPQAPPVVILHKIMGHGREWDVLTAALAPAHRVVAVDQHGHGRSAWASDYTAATMAADLLAVIDGLALGRPAVAAGAGGSTGRPERVVLAQQASEHADDLGQLSQDHEKKVGEKMRLAAAIPQLKAELDRVSKRSATSPTMPTSGGGSSPTVSGSRSSVSITSGNCWTSRPSTAGGSGPS